MLRPVTGCLGCLGKLVTNTLGLVIALVLVFVCFALCGLIPATK